jgi:hypothetical protein
MVVEGLLYHEDVRAALLHVLTRVLGAPSVTLQPAPVMAVVSTGRWTGLVVDVGHRDARVLPVVAGAPVMAALRVFPFAAERALAALALPLCDAVLAKASAAAAAAPPSAAAAAAAAAIAHASAAGPLTTVAALIASSTSQRAGHVAAWTPSVAGPLASARPYTDSAWLPTLLGPAAAAAANAAGGGSGAVAAAFMRWCEELLVEHAHAPQQRDAAGAEPGIDDGADAPTLAVTVPSDLSLRLGLVAPPVQVASVPARPYARHAAAPVEPPVVRLPPVTLDVPRSWFSACLAPMFAAAADGVQGAAAAGGPAPVADAQPTGRGVGLQGGPLAELRGLRDTLAAACAAPLPDGDLADAVCDALAAAPVDARGALAGSIVLVGGVATLRGVGAALMHDVRSAILAAAGTRLCAGQLAPLAGRLALANVASPLVAPWAGGSALAHSLATLSRVVHAEPGAAVAAATKGGPVLPSARLPERVDGLAHVSIAGRRAGAGALRASDGDSGGSRIHPGAGRLGPFGRFADGVDDPTMGQLAPELPDWDARAAATCLRDWTAVATPVLSLPGESEHVDRQGSQGAAAAGAGVAAAAAVAAAVPLVHAAPRGGDPAAATAGDAKRALPRALSSARVGPVGGVGVAKPGGTGAAAGKAQAPAPVAGGAAPAADGADAASLPASSGASTGTTAGPSAAAAGGDAASRLASFKDRFATARGRGRGGSGPGRS